MSDAPNIEDVLKMESDSEKVEIEKPSDLSAVEEKAEDKYKTMNEPTERKTSEEVAKLAGQIHSAEEQMHLSNILRQGTVNPEHQTFGVLGMPLAAATHDFTLDSAAQAQSSVKSKNAEDQKKINEHNASLKQIVDAISKGNEK